MNTAVGWLLQTELSKLPARIKSAAAELRDALATGVVTELHVWYVHNLPESQNVADELSVVESTASSALKANYGHKQIRISAAEIGSSTLKRWYDSSLTPILVNDKFRVQIRSGFPIQSDKWEAYVSAIPASFLWRVYRRHKTALFSANVRDYLGSRKTDQNINFGIKQTAEADPDNFWVFNNGVTLLVNDFIEEQTKAGVFLDISGLSVVNGAQTTGAIGSLKRSPGATAYVPVRLIKTNDRDVIYDVIRYNNSQNKVTAPDFRSTDRIQKRLREEMARIPKAEYEGGRRGGHEDLIRRRANLLPSYTVGQALAAFHGDAVVAYNQKSNIWINDSHYAKYFNDDTTAAHMLFCYSLLRAVEARKTELFQKSKDKADSLTNAEQKQLEFFRNRGSTYLFVSAIAACVETFVGRKVSSLFRASFSVNVPPVVGQNYWRDIVMRTAPLCSHLEDAFSDGLKNNERVRKAVQTFQGLVEVTASANEKIYKEFAGRVFIR